MTTFSAGSVAVDREQQRQALLDDQERQRRQDVLGDMLLEDHRRRTGESAPVAPGSPNVSQDDDRRLMVDEQDEIDFQ
jgi:hypothetical protein